MDVLIFIVLAVISFILASATHELGHVLTGLIEGFKFHLFVAGPLGVKRDENDRIVVYFEKDISLWGGIAATLPQEADQDNYKKFGRLLLGGPLISILIGTVSLIPGVLIDQIFLTLFGLMSIGMGMVSLIPMRNGAFYTDGGRWLRMHKNEATKAVEMAIWNLTQNAIIQGDYTNANLDKILILKNDGDVRTQYLGHYFACQYYKANQDSENLEIAKAALEGLRGKVPKQMVSMFKVD